MPHWTEEFFVSNADLFERELRQKDDRAEREVTNLRSLVSETFDSTPSSVLDVGCGLGRHCIEFANAGLDVTGIDISPDYLEKARESAEEAEVADQIAFRELDMRELDSMADTFELAVCLYNTFGYFDEETNVDVLRKMRQRLTDDGVCVVELTNRDAALLNFRSEVVRETDFGMVVEHCEFDTRTSRMSITRDVLSGDAPDFEYDGRVEYSVRQYSPPELDRAFRDAGFEDVTIFGGYEGEDPSLDRGRLVALAR